MMPETLQAFVARRLMDGIALVFIALGALSLIALLSHNPADPSWNTAVSGAQTIHNWGGRLGAWIADFLVQTLGVAGFVLALTSVIWGIRIARRQALRPLWLRTLALVVGTFATAAASAQIPAHDWGVHPYLGSTLGTLTFMPLLDASKALGGFLGPGLLAGFMGVVAISSFVTAAAFTRAEIKAAAKFFWDVLVFTTAKLASWVLGFIAWVRHYNDPNYVPAQISLLQKMRQLAAAHVPKLPERRTKGPVIERPKYAPVPKQQTAPQSAPAPSQKPAKSKAQEDIPVVKPQTSSASANTLIDNQQSFSLNYTGDWELPPISLLQSPPEDLSPAHLNEAVLRKNAELLQNVLADFNIEGEIVSIHPGPVVTLYELEPAPGTKTSRVISLSDDIARSMSAVSVRIAVVPGRSVIGIELPNSERMTVYMQEMLASKASEKTKAKLPLLLGKDISGQPIIADLAKMPHLLVAGTTGSGKSVAVNTMILSLIYRLPPEKCRFIMIDPKMLELSAYNDIPHLLSPVVTEPGKAVVSLKWAVMEMEERYRAMSKLGVRNIEGYNARLREAAKNGEVLMRKLQTGFDPETGKPVYEEQPLDLTELPYIVVIVDEFADLMLVAGKDVEGAIQRLAQMARAAGIHLIMATQRPSVDVITGVIKANFPTRISFQVTSKVDSRTILGEGGAEQLLGMGDMLYMAPGGQVTRVHGPFVSDGDVEKVTDFLRAQGDPSYIEDVTEGGNFGDGSEVMGALFSEDSSDSQVDELYDKAVALVAREGKASTSFVQRYLQIGYNRAARIIEEMERQGIISPATATGKREVLVRDFSDV